MQIYFDSPSPNPGHFLNEKLKLVIEFTGEDLQEFKLAILQMHCELLNALAERKIQNFFAYPAFQVINFLSLLNSAEIQYLIDHREAQELKQANEQERREKQ